MNQFTRTLTGFRFVETNVGDTLQIIAARELGDAARWVDIVNINNLLPPYLTNDPTQAGPSVKLFGQFLLVPAATPQVSAEADPDAVFGTDLALDNYGNLFGSNGDFATVAGRANLRQALENAVDTDFGELIFHQLYGCDVRRLVGKVNGPTAELLAAQRVNTTLQRDSRVKSASSTATAQGDTLPVTSVVVPIAGAPINISSAGNR
jgi:phage baseplate assembly protein W